MCFFFFYEAPATRISTSGHPFSLPDRLPTSRPQRKVSPSIAWQPDTSIGAGGLDVRAIISPPPRTSIIVPAYANMVPFMRGLHLGAPIGPLRAPRAPSQQRHGRQDR